MKKGIVMERHRKYTILMTKDGSFEKGRVLSNQTEVGEEVVFRPIGNRQVMLRKHRGIPWKVSLLAAAILLVILPIYFISNGDKAYAYVTIDINPSIEMKVNEQFQVQEMKAINDDGVVIKELLEFKHQSIEKVISQIILESEGQGYTDDKNMVVGISYVDEEQSLPIPSDLQSYFSTLSEWKVALLVIPDAIRQEAHDQQTSMNEMMATHLNDGENDVIKEDTLDPNDRAIINSFYNETEEADPEQSQMEPDVNEENESITTEEQTDSNEDHEPDKEEINQNNEELEHHQEDQASSSENEDSQQEQENSHETDEHKTEDEPEEKEKDEHPVFGDGDDFHPPGRNDQPEKQGPPDHVPPQAKEKGNNPD